MDTSSILQNEVNRRPQIDGLRAATMIGVLYIHFWHAGPMLENVRVSLFFVISGFLITHILYRAKKSGRVIIVKNFYVRRFLRLFPPIIVAVLVAYIFDMDGFRSSAFFHLFQMSNIYYSFAVTQHPWIMGHLWSLNVLEQFYLVIPILIFFNGDKRLYIIVVLLWISAVFMRVNAEHLGIVAWLVKIILPFDPIVAGIFTALLVQYQQVSALLKSRWVLISSIAIVLSPLVLWEGFGKSESYRLLVQPALCALVAGAFFGYGGILGRTLSGGLFRFLSKISYGVYIYHIPIWWLFGERNPAFYQAGPLTFVVLSTASVLAATVSWFAIEEPISRLKRYFPTSAERTE